MIDFLKISCENTEFIYLIYDNRLLKKYSVSQTNNTNFFRKPDEFNQANYIKEYRGIYFCFYARKINSDYVFTKLEILIKPHYFFNNNLHNANNFTATNCMLTLLAIKKLFKLPVNEFKIINIEYGINFLSPIDCKELIEYTYYHGRNIFFNISNLKYAKISTSTTEKGTFNKYKQVKFYNKGIQFPQYTNPDTGRFEIRSKRTAYIKKLNIYTYNDLLNPKTYDTLAKELIKEFKQVLIIDINNNKENLNNKEKLKLEKYTNPINWNISLQKSKNTFNNEKKKYFELLNKTGSNIHTNLSSIIEIKLNKLLKNCADFRHPKNKKKCAYSTLYIIENGTKNNF